MTEDPGGAGGKAKPDVLYQGGADVNQRGRWAGWLWKRRREREGSLEKQETLRWARNCEDPEDLKLGGTSRDTGYLELGRTSGDGIIRETSSSKS